MEGRFIIIFFSNCSGNKESIRNIFATGRVSFLTSKYSKKIKSILICVVITAIGFTSNPYTLLIAWIFDSFVSLELRILIIISIRKFPEPQAGSKTFEPNLYESSIIFWTRFEGV